MSPPGAGAVHHLPFVSPARRSPGSGSAPVSRKQGWRSVFAPATVANFGSGFDVFGIALREAGGRSVAGVPNSRPLGDIVRVRRTKTRGVRIVSITGDGGRLPASSGRNCAAVAAREILRSSRSRFGLDLILEKGLPLSSGLGSSAASAAAAAWAARLAVGGEPGRASRKDRPDLLAGSLAGEHVADGAWHGDNVWASLLGGAVIVLSVSPAEVITLSAPPRFRWVTVHPDYRLDTRRARAVLPKRVPLLEATAQAGRFASLAFAWTSGDRRGIGRGLADLFAEPARAPLVPGFAQAKRAALRAGAYGMTFSGAGPSVVAVTPAGEEEGVGRAIRRAFAREGLGSTQFICSVDPLGAREVE